MALKGVKVVEMIGLAPGPFCGTILADFGATVTVVNKIQPPLMDAFSNGKRMISVNLKTEEGVDIVRKLSKSSDVLVDTFRPGVMEKLGLGPDKLLEDNPRLVYARLTGYGQTGDYKNRAGHDINYVSMSGFLSMLSKNGEPPRPPINFAADFAGGSLTCAFGILLALLERTRSGKGQVVDCSMTEGAAYLATWFYKVRNTYLFSKEPGNSILDGGAAFYRTYKTKDGKFMAVGALEPQFYSQLVKGLNLPEDKYPQTMDADVITKFEEVFLTKSQEEWCNIFKDLDACVTPVLQMDTVGQDECHRSRNAFYTNTQGLNIPEPAPKLSLTPAVSVGRKPPTQPGHHTIEILKELGYSKVDIDALLKKGFVFASSKCSI